MMEFRCSKCGSVFRSNAIVRCLCDVTRKPKSADPGIPETIRAQIIGLCLDLAEKDDRTSPEDQPDMMLITGEEYQQALEYIALAAIRATTEAAAKYIREHPIPHPAFDERLCCDGRDCGCLGSTVGQQEAHYLAEDLSANKHIGGSDDE